ncbi:MAG: NTP transferase domain-containing protein [Candidatus Tenebribacter mawsonii]|nr:NTP transferase domain-containing protein [Candidatus Tenebribacter mawsonii]
MLETIILSAGQSSRMGRDKALLDINGIPAIIHIINKVISFSDHIYIILGDNLESVKSRVLEYFENHDCISFIHNEVHLKGMFSSIRKGFQEVKGENGIMLQLIDQPFISQNVYEELVSNYSSENLIMQPSYIKGEFKRGGHPLVFAPAFKDIVLSHADEYQLNEIIKKYSERRKFIEVTDESILHNLNTKKDFNDKLSG